jgi:hypothetical protein
MATGPAERLALAFFGAAALAACCRILALVMAKQREGAMV